MSIPTWRIADQAGSGPRPPAGTMAEPRFTGGLQWSLVASSVFLTDDSRRSVPYFLIGREIGAGRLSSSTMER